jgi:hypothetical protein
VTWYPKDKDDGWFPREKAKPPTLEAVADYEKLYVYGSHLQPGLERSPTYLTPREREVQEGQGQELYERSVEERSGIAVRGEERRIAEQQYRERLAQTQPRAVQAPVSFEEIATKAYGVQARLAGVGESLTILQYKMKGYQLVERREGELVFAMPEPARGIAETLLGFETKPLIGYFGIKPVAKTPLEFVKPRETVRPFAGVAGVIAPFEATAYTVGTLAGFKTPRIPPTFISLAPGRAMEYGPEYAVGTIVGDVTLSIVAGKVAGKVWDVIPKAVKAPLEKIVGAVAKPFRPITQPIMARLEKAALWPYERLAPGIVDIPEFAKPLAKELMYQEWAWELAESPKMSALLITKYTGETGGRVSSWVSEHWLKTVTGGLSYVLVKSELEAVKPISEASRVGFPYVPTVGTVKTASTLFPLLLPRGLTRLTPEIRVKQPAFEESFEIQKLKLFPQAYPMQRQRDRAIPMLTLASSLEPLTKNVSLPSLKLEVPQISKQEQKQRLIPMLKMAVPTPFLQKQTLSLPRIPRIPSFHEPNFKRLQKGLFGEWFKRSHAMPTGKQIMKELGFGSTRRATRKVRGVKRRSR